MTESTWTITRTECDAEAIAAADSVFTVSNGYLALKGNLQEYHLGRYPTTIVAGIFDEADMIRTIPPTARERRWLDAKLFDDPRPCPSVANLPDPLFLRVFLNRREVRFDRGTVTGFRQASDLRRGLYWYEYSFRDEGCEIAIKMERFASMAHPHRAAMRYTITPIGGVEKIMVRSGIDGAVHPAQPSDGQFDVTDAQADADGTCALFSHLHARGIDVETRTATVSNVKPAVVSGLEETKRAYTVLSYAAQPGQPMVLEKYIAIGTSDDKRRNAECDVEAELEALQAQGFDAALAENEAWWRETWERVDVEIEGDDLAQRYLRFCLMHLVSAAPRHTDTLSVPCKLLSGEWYQGAVFYDTDLYILPFYTFVMPEVARGCLNYRYLGLAHARSIARHLGYAGAKFAWQAGPCGEEVLAPWYRFVHTNIHIDADVAYALMLYRNATADRDFMREKGLDILVECARFYASRAIRDRDEYHLKDVSGPDEGHCESTDNFYTNVLAAKTLRWAADTLDHLSAKARAHYDRAVKRLNVGEGEPEAWRRVADGLVLRFDPETKVYEQYDGYYALKPIPPGFRDNQKEWWFTVFPFQAIHQPDVVMALTMLREEVPDDVYRANYEFYRDKSMDFSSMSHVIHALSAKDIGDMRRAYRQFVITAGEDIDERLTGRGDTADGLHGTATGGAWMAAVMGFGGIRLTDKGLTVDPRLPEHWKSLKFSIWLRGERLRFEVTQESVKIQVGNEAAFEMPANICGQDVVLKSGETITTKAQRHKEE